MKVFLNEVRKVYRRGGVWVILSFEKGYFKECWVRVECLNGEELGLGFLIGVSVFEEELKKVLFLNNG